MEERKEGGKVDGKREVRIYPKRKGGWRKGSRRGVERARRGGWKGEGGMEGGKKRQLT